MPDRPQCGPQAIVANLLPFLAVVHLLGDTCHPHCGLWSVLLCEKTRKNHSQSWNSDILASAKGDNVKCGKPKISWDIHKERQQRVEH